jgi:hypothetical protein
MGRQGHNSQRGFRLDSGRPVGMMAGVTVKNGRGRELLLPAQRQKLKVLIRPCVVERFEPWHKHFRRARKLAAEMGS